MKDKKNIEIVFAPGCFDNFEGTQEELNELVANIHQMIENGTIEEHSRQITAEDFDELPEEVQLQLARTLLDPEDQHLIPNARPLQ